MTLYQLQQVAAILPKGARQEIAAACGVSAGTVTRVLEGKRKSPKVEAELCRYLSDLGERTKNLLASLACVK